MSHNYSKTKKAKLNNFYIPFELEPTKNKKTVTKNRRCYIDKKQSIINKSKKHE